jgi:hypothetical protein
MRLFPNQGICDPHVHIYNGRAYMFATHDRAPGCPHFFMDDWKVFSSDDLINWKEEYTLHPEDTFLGTCSDCYATDSAERNGKYYFYFSEGQTSTGVAVADRPEGPYKDALGKPLLPKGLVDTACYDPTVFIDDDEARTPYILFGYTVFGKKYYIARLNEDMISLAEEPRPIEMINGWQNDANWLTKRNGVYYLNSHGGEYAVSDNIYGPYTYRGNFCRDALVDHGTFFTFHNQTYFTYGIPQNWGEDEPVDRFFRDTKMLYAHYKDNGDIVIDEFIQEVGVGQYDAAWPAIKGEWFFAASDGVYKKENADGFELRGITDGAYLYYQNVHGMRQNTKLCVRGRCGSAPCQIEVREGSPFGAVLGCIKVQPEGDEAREYVIPLTNTHGTHSLCFVFRGEGEDIFAFDEFRFTT